MMCFVSKISYMATLLRSQSRAGAGRPVRIFYLPVLERWLVAWTWVIDSEKASDPG